jgi:hypothetical protein
MFRGGGHHLVGRRQIPFELESFRLVLPEELDPFDHAQKTTRKPRVGASFRVYEERAAASPPVSMLRCPAEARGPAPLPRQRLNQWRQILCAGKSHAQTQVNWYSGFDLRFGGLSGAGVGGEVDGLTFPPRDLDRFIKQARGENDGQVGTAVETDFDLVERDGDGGRQIDEIAKDLAGRSSTASKTPGPNRLSTTRTSRSVPSAITCATNRSGSAGNRLLDRFGHVLTRGRVSGELAHCRVR